MLHIPHSEHAGMPHPPVHTRRLRQSWLHCWRRHLQGESAKCERWTASMAERLHGVIAPVINAFSTVSTSPMCVKSATTSVTTQSAFSTVCVCGHQATAVSASESQLHGACHHLGSCGRWLLHAHSPACMVQRLHWCSRQQSRCQHPPAQGRPCRWVTKCSQSQQ